MKDSYTIKCSDQEAHSKSTVKAYARPPPPVADPKHCLCYVTLTAMHVLCKRRKKLLREIPHFPHKFTKRTGKARR